MTAERAPRIAIDRYVLDTLMADLVGHDRAPAAFVVFLYLWKASRGARRGRVRVSHAGIADETGLSKSGVQTAIRRLKRRQLVRSFQSSPTATPEYVVLRPWAKPAPRQKEGR